MEKLYTVEEVSKILQVTENILRIWLREGKIKGKKVSRHWRIYENDLKEWLDSNEK